MLLLTTVALLGGATPASLEPVSQVLVQGVERPATARTDAGASGIGPAYRVEWSEADGSLRFTPRLGAEAASATWTLELESVGRAGVRRSVGDGSRLAEVAPGRLRLEHGGGLGESVELLAEGAKHSVVFAAPPAGAGDLVASFELGLAGLEAAPSGPGEALRWRAGEFGGVSLGRVLGIDAAGREAAGTAVVEGGRLELRLPADFVDAASYPLVLDPLIGAFTSTGSGESDQATDLDYCAAADNFLLVYRVDYSATDSDTYAQRLAPDGGLIGPPLILDGTAMPVTTGARVAADGELGVYGVVWERFDGLSEWLEVIGIRASDGAIGTTAVLDVGSGIAYDPDLGGPGAAGRWLAAFRGPLGSITGALLEIAADAGVTVVPVSGAVSFDVSTAFQDFRPRVSARPSEQTGLWLVGWERFFATPSPGDLDLVGRTVTSAGTTPTAEVFLASVIGTDEVELDTAAIDFDRFAVAYAAETPDGDYDALGVNVTVSPFGTIVGPTATLRADPSDSERRPAIAFNGTSLAVALQVGGSTPFGAPRRIQVAGFDPLSLAVYEDFTPLPVAGDFEFDPSLASRWPDAAGCLSAFTVDPFGSVPTDVGIQEWRPATGAVTPLLDGACGPFETSAYGAFGGNAGFNVVLKQGAGTVANVLLLSANRIDLPCGTCLLVPDPTSGPVFVAPVSIFGASTHLDLPIPAAASGRTYYLQWLTASAGTPSCPELGVTLRTPIEVFVD